MKILPTVFGVSKTLSVLVLTLVSYLLSVAPALALVPPALAFPRPAASPTAAPDPGYAIASWGAGRSDVFTRGPDGAVYHCVEYRSPSCREGSNPETLFGRTIDVTKWENLGGVIVGSPAAVSWGNGRIDLFARGTDDALWHKYYDNGSWSSWSSLGGIITSSPTVASWGPGHLDVFARGTDNALWHRYYLNGWSGWSSLGGIITSSPSAVSTSSGTIDVFARGTDNAIWHRTFNGHWQGWQSLGGVKISAPAALKVAPGVVGVFALGQGNVLYHRYKSNIWSGWVSLGGNWANAPAVVGTGGFSFRVLADSFTGSSSSPLPSLRSRTSPTVNIYSGANPYNPNSWSGTMPWHLAKPWGIGGDTARIDMAWTPFPGADSYDIFVEMTAGCIVLVWDPVAFGLVSPTYRVEGGATSTYSAHTAGYCRGSQYRMRIRYHKGSYVSDWSEWSHYTIP